MKSKLKQGIRFLLRVDVFNRIIVFISMVLFLILPSYVLYSITNYNNNINIVLPCLLLLSALIGTGLFALYNPVKLSMFYFLELVIILVTYSKTFTSFYIIDERINQTAIFILETCYCVIGFLFNAFFCFKYLFRRKNRYAFKELTNSDSIYDFLNARPYNKKIETKIEDISRTSKRINLMPSLKKLKLSKTMRTITYISVLILTIYYFLNILAQGNIENNPITSVLIILVLTTSSAISFTSIFPKDYRYAFFYNVCILEVAGIFCCKYSELNPFMFIICLIWAVLSLLAALITEGRTWMGATPDDL